MKKINYNWLKWIGVLPVSILAYAVMFYGINLINYITKFFWTVDKWSMFYWFQYLIPIIANACGAYFYVQSGSNFAPNHKKKTAFILFTLLFIITLVSIVMRIIEKEYSELIAYFAMLISAFYAYKTIETENYKT